ncbi:ApbE family protein [compost metagenome]
MLSVTLTAPTAEEADALSTTLYVLGRERAEALLKRHPGCAALYVEAGAGPDDFRLVPGAALAWEPWR